MSQKTFKGILAMMWRHGFCREKTAVAGRGGAAAWTWSLFPAAVSVMSTTMNAPSSTRSSQGSRVAQELEVLRQKQLAKSQRQKLKDSKWSFNVRFLWQAWQG